MVQCYQRKPQKVEYVTLKQTKFQNSTVQCDTCNFWFRSDEDFELHLDSCSDFIEDTSFTSQTHPQKIFDLFDIKILQDDFGYGSSTVYSQERTFQG